MADINFGILDTQMPGRIAAIPQQQQAQQAQNAMQLMQVQQTMQQNALAKAKMEEYTRGAAEKNALRNRMTQPGFNIYDPAHQADIMALSPDLAPGLIKHALDVETAKSTTARNVAQTGVAQAGITKAKREFGNEARRSLAFNPSDANIQAWNEDAVKRGFITQQEADLEVQDMLRVPLDQRKTVFERAGAPAVAPVTPTELSKYVSERAAMLPGDPRIANWDAKIAELSTAPAAQRDITNRQGAERNRISLGQLNLGQSKFAWEKANPGYELKQDENGDWFGVNKRTLQTTPVTAPTTAPNAPSAAEGAVPAKQFKGRNQATASQEGAAYNANRILTSAKQIQSAVNKNADSNAPGLSEAVSSAVGLEGVSNLLRGPQRQIVAGAQADIIDSLLFLATGAAYNKEQLAQQRASYLPAYTDKPEALAAKQERLLGLITAVKSKSGSRWTKEMDDAVSSLRVNAAAPPPTTTKPSAAGAGVTVRDW